MPRQSDQRPPTRTGVAILGHGTVGRGVVRILGDSDGDLARRTGLAFDPVAVAVRDPGRHRDVAAGVPITSDADAAAVHPSAAVVLELMGGVERPRELVLKALAAGKHVVTANKALVAAHGAELVAAARDNGVSIAFEASCGGGIPIVGALTNGLLANRCQALVGILNGTSNFILTRMTDGGDSYADALAEAQRLGFAEADPSLDVNGRDVAQKLAILAGLAFGERIDERSIHVEGIESLDAADIAYAGELGYVVKLLAIAQRDDEDGRLTLSVFPGLVAARSPLADVKGPFNAVTVFGDALGQATFVGRGAGQTPTASAVVADLISVVGGGYPAMFRQLRTLPDLARPADVIDFEQARHRYYLRLVAQDAPGVLADVTRCLGNAGISLTAVLQHEIPPGDQGRVPVVVTTHVSREGSVRRAVAQIDALPSILEPPVVLRIADLPTEAIG